MARLTVTLLLSIFGLVTSINIDYSGRIINGSVSNLGNNNYASRGVFSTGVVGTATGVGRPDERISYGSINDGRAPPAVADRRPIHNVNRESQTPTTRGPEIDFRGAEISGDGSDFNRGVQVPEYHDQVVLDHGTVHSPNRDSSVPDLVAQTPTDHIPVHSVNRAPSASGTEIDFTGAKISGSVSNIGQGSNAHSHAVVQAPIDRGSGQNADRTVQTPSHYPKSGGPEIDSRGDTSNGPPNDGYRDTQIPFAVGHGTVLDKERGVHVTKPTNLIPIANTNIGAQDHGNLFPNQRPQVYVNFEGARIGGSVSNIGNNMQRSY